MLRTDHSWPNSGNMVRCIIFAMALTCILTGCETTPKSVEENPNGAAVIESEPRDLYEKVRRASVEVLVDGRLEGSGWFADAQGWIITASHVVYGRGSTLEVRSPIYGRMLAEVVAVDRGHDLALLRVQPRRGHYATLTIAKKTPNVRESVYVYGAPQFRHDVMLAARVARSTPAYEFFGDHHLYVRCYYITGSTPLGTSGGCWVNERGEVVGNQAGLINQNGAPVGVSFGPPPQAIASLVMQPLTVRTATLGCGVEELWEHSPSFINRFDQGVAGLVPVATVQGGPAHAAGLSNEMVITHIDGQRVRMRDELLTFIRNKRPGDTVELLVMQPDKQPARRIRVTLGEL